jgi:hypothetical protein
MPVSDQCLGVFLDTPSIAPRAICMAIYAVHVLYVCLRD